ncbi:MAG: DUF3450 domain-containing protein [Pseudomonadota bacterium]
MQNRDAASGLLQTSWNSANHWGARMRFKESAAIAGLLAALLVPQPVLAVEEAITDQQASDTAAAASQGRIDSMADATSQALQSYRIALQRSESLEIYNTQLARLIESQQAEIASITRQTNEIETIETGALPLMIEMTATLGELVEADVPFLVAERTERIDNLRALIDRADVTAGEKFRRIMEAYLIEVDYGRTIEAYRGELQTGGDVRTVDFLRVGRVGLYYQTLDGGESGRWNVGRGSWETVSGDYRRQIEMGLRIARKQAPPELLTLPITASGDAA